MNALPDSNASETTEARRELAELHRRAAETRLVLSDLQRDVEAAEKRLSANQTAQLVEVNERLVISMLDAQAQVETAGRKLEEATRSAEIDQLTGLPNRALLFDRFVQAIANAKRRKGRLAVMFVDLDNFKQINDTLGHAVGDEVLRLAAGCLVASVRESDTVSRHGGDEFLIMLAEVTQRSDVMVIAEKVIAALGMGSRDGACGPLTASLGISVYPEDGTDADTLISRADAAMYRAKKSGRGGFAFHGESPVRGQADASSEPDWPERPSSEDDKRLSEYINRHAQLCEANEHLLIAALGAQELQIAAELAQRRQTELLVLVAHELRNPLTPIRTAAALLGHKFPNETMLPRLQAIIERQVGHLSRLVGDLLDVSRAHTGKFRLECEMLEMAAVFEAAIETCRPAMESRRQQFSLQMPEGALLVFGDPVRLAQVVSNLLDNASKYTQSEGEIRIVVAVEGDAMIMEVSDNGIGINAETLSSVFEPFVQDVQAVGFNGVGLGVGLTVVRELVEAHGGTVTASSGGSGLGSCFVVVLPLVGDMSRDNEFLRNAAPSPDF